MKILKVILIIVVVLAAIFFIGGMFLPKTYSVSRSIVVNAPDSMIYKNIADFNNFLKWNPWYKMEPTATVDISGVPLQPGHLYKWKGDKSGEGQMLITKIEKDKHVDIELKFLKPFESIAQTTFELDTAKNGTYVTWTMKGANNSTMEKWMGLCFNGMIGGDFEDGLKGLKDLSEEK